MEKKNENRGAQLKTTAIGKKIQAILDNKEFFQTKMDIFLQTCIATVKEEDEDEKRIDGRDINVCIRARPLLDYELEEGYFNITQAFKQQFYLLEPKLDVRLRPTLDNQKNIVDFAFGGDDSNAKVYEQVILPMVDLCLNGGMSSCFAYGQTGSGKTYTIQGFLTRIADDLFKRQQGSQFNEDGTSRLKFYVSFIQIIGNDVYDLLKENQAVVIGENKFGKVEIQGNEEYEIEKPQDFYEMNQVACSNRATKSTFKNDTSSRSHSVCRIRIYNSFFKSMEPGEFFIIDLAGSENASDMQFHDKDLVKQTQMINFSLMALKDCIRNRAQAVLDPSKNVHVPYRKSKLTLLLKDAFELKSNKHCKTTIIANVAPSVADLVMSKNTLRFIVPIKIQANKKVNTDHLDEDKDSPQTWSNEMLREWVNTYSKGKVDCEKFCPHESGKQILSIPEAEFIQRLLEQGFLQGRCKQMYDKLWQKLIDARTKSKKKQQVQTKFDLEKRQFYGAGGGNTKAGNENQKTPTCAIFEPKRPAPKPLSNNVFKVAKKSVNQSKQKPSWGPVDGEKKGEYQSFQNYLDEQHQDEKMNRL